MNLIELNGALRQLRLSGIAGVLETRLLQAQSEAMAPIDLISILVSDELSCRSQRLLERRRKQARFRDANKTLDNFDFQFNPKMNRALVFDMATAAFIGRREDARRQLPHLISAGNLKHCSVCGYPFKPDVQPSMNVAFADHLRTAHHA